MSGFQRFLQVQFFESNCPVTLHMYANEMHSKFYCFNSHSFKLMSILFHSNFIENGNVVYIPRRMK